jgi:F-type H+-transporting ATPase subunit delta|tara:strand:- start:1037 stop:1684 length:648 start_codon:yes stop_codon:yes gene_type:complete
VRVFVKFLVILRVAFTPNSAAIYGIFLLSAHESVISGIAGRYAAALFDLMNEMPESDQQLIHANVAGFKAVLDDNADLQNLVRSPVITAEEQAAALGKLLAQAGAHQLFQNFVALVVQNRRAMALSEMARQYGALVAGARDEMVAEIASASALDDGQIVALTEQLKSHFGKTVTVETRTDPDLLGGMVVKIGSRMIDGSLRTKLNSLKTAMNEAH